MRTVLSIAGSGSRGGAGIRAHIKTMTASGVYAMSAITTLTAQNTTGVRGILEIPSEFLALQIDSGLFRNTDAAAGGNFHRLLPVRGCLLGYGLGYESVSLC